MTLKDIVVHSLKKGGCCYSTKFGDLAGSPFFCLSINKEREEVILLSELTDDVIKEYYLKNSDLLSLDDRALGTWIYKDEVYIDVVTLYPKDNTDLYTIQQLLIDHEQHSAWDLELNQEIIKY